MRLAMSGVAALLGLIPAMALRPWTPVQLALFAVILSIFAIPEELGWRGYALPKLLKAHSPLIAGLIIGVIWGSVHLALHRPGMIHAGLPLLPVVLEVTALSVLGTWLYVRTGGNVLLTSVFHGALGFFVIVNEGITQAQQLWLMAGVYGAIALVVAIAAGPSFARKPTTQPAAIGQAIAVD
jgi:membrane protease YdiL (CAAX protease family)